MVFNPCLVWSNLLYHKTTNMKYNELTAFIIGISLIVIAAILYGWSDNTSNGQLGRNLETISIIVLIAALINIVISFLISNKQK